MVGKKIPTIQSFHIKSKIRILHLKYKNLKKRLNLNTNTETTKRNNFIDTTSKFFNIEYKDVNERITDLNGLKLYLSEKEGKRQSKITVPAILNYKNTNKTIRKNIQF